MTTRLNFDIALDGRLSLGERIDAFDRLSQRDQGIVEEILYTRSAKRKICPDCGTALGQTPHCTTCATLDPLEEEEFNLTTSLGAAPDLKYDGGKPRMDLLVSGMPRALQEVAEVMTFGARKYEDHSWKTLDRAEPRYMAASLRHEIALAKGEEQDPESGLHHLAHKICCDLFRLELALQGSEVS